MDRIVEVDGKQLKMTANARIPRIYRNTFGSDMLLDMQRLYDSYKDVLDEGASMPMEMLTIFENVAWVLLREGGEEVGDSPDDWLESLDGIFSIYEVLPQILELWSANMATTSTPKKK